MHPEQQKLLEWIDDHKRDMAVVCISRQFGKTFLLLCYAISFALRNPRTMTLFVAPHLQQLDKILMPRVNQIFQFLPDDLVPTRRQDSWTFHNGSVVRLDGVSVGRGVSIRGDVPCICVS